MKISNQSKIKTNLLTGLTSFGILVVSTVGLHYSIDRWGADTPSEALASSEGASKHQTTPAMVDMYEASVEDEMGIVSQTKKVQESISREREEERKRKKAEEEARLKEIQLAKQEAERKEAERKRLAKIEQEKIEKKKQVNQSKVKENKAVENKEKPKGKTMMMEATAYTADCNGCSGITATGLNLKANRDAKVIAVDPNVIPLGSKVYIEGYGTAIASDTGGRIKGKIIDLHMPTKQQALNWGRRTVKVTILD